jgi:hypothetical protein
LLSDDWRRMNGQQKESRSQALGRAVADLGEGILGVTNEAHCRLELPLG